jgi:hypothetical protein
MEMRNEKSRREFLVALAGGSAAIVSGGFSEAKDSAHSPSLCKLEGRLSHYDGNRLAETTAVPLAQSGMTNAPLRFQQADWACNCRALPVPGRPEAIDFFLRFKVTGGSAQNCSIGARLGFEDWSKENYVLMPGALYNGNRFESRRLKYPPLVEDPADIAVKGPIIVTDIPRLNNHDGPSRVQLVTGDVATPAMGFYSPRLKSAVWLLTEQATRLGDTGLGIEETDQRDKAFFTLTAPRVRELYKYTICDMQRPSKDRGADLHAGDEVEMRFRLYVFPAESVQTLFDRFVEIRKDLSGPTKLRHQIPFSQAWEIQEEKYNRQNWVEQQGFYSVGLRENIYQTWQIGWVGGLMVTYPLLVEGNATSQARARRNFDFVFPKGMGPSGFFHGVGDGEKWYNDGFGKPYAAKWHLLRKSADALYFILKQFLLLRKKDSTWKPTPAWELGTTRCANAFMRLWEKYGQFGQFVDLETGDIVVGGSTSAATACAGLALAAGFFSAPDYLRAAEAAADDYYERYVKAGISVGGPGEACQCPDSESAFGLLESFVVLYETTGDGKWLRRACDMAHQCATWMVSYNFHFPPQSLFGRLEMHSTGSVFANAQNKHSAPGIATLSGDSLFKLYRYTGKRIYLELIQELAHNLPQYLSRADRPVGKMPPGWMNERVELGDWLEPIGEIFNGSCWCEVSNMLTWVGIPGLYVQPDAGLVCAIDHIDVETTQNTRQRLAIRVTNPTKFIAVVKVFAENSAQARQMLGQNGLWNCPKVKIPPGRSTSLHFRKSDGRLSTAS